MRHDQAERKRERDRQAALNKYGEWSAEGRPPVEVDGMDKLLFMLRIVHGKPRYDLYEGLK